MSVEVAWTHGPLEKRRVGKVHLRRSTADAFTLCGVPVATRDRQVIPTDDQRRCQRCKPK